MDYYHENPPIACFIVLGIEPLLSLFEMRDDTREPGEGQQGCGYEFRYNWDLTNPMAMLECGGKRGKMGISHLLTNSTHEKGAKWQL